MDVKKKIRSISKTSLDTSIESISNCLSPRTIYSFSVPYLFKIKKKLLNHMKNQLDLAV